MVEHSCSAGDVAQYNIFNDDAALEEGRVFCELDAINLYSTPSYQAASRAYVLQGILFVFGA